MTKGLNRFIKCFLGGLLTISVIFSCNDSPYMQGKRLYLANCANCHMEDGSGLSALIPSIQKSVYLGKPEIACILKNGLRDTIFKDSTFLVREMPAFKKFSATEITNIVNFVNHSWYTSFKETTITQIEEAINICQ